MNKNVIFFLATLVIVAFQALFVSAGAIDLVMRQGWLPTATAMAAIGLVFAVANRHELRIGRFVSIPVILALFASIAIVGIAWRDVSTAFSEKGYWTGVVMLFASLLPFVTLVISGVTFFFWHDWGFDNFLLKPENACGNCQSEISADVKFCPRCGTEVRHD